MFSSPEPSPVVAPDAPAPPPLLGQQPNRQKPGKRSMQPTFLGQSSSPSAGASQPKTLLGQ